MYKSLKNWFIGGLPLQDSISETRRVEFTFQFLFVYALILILPFPFFYTQFTNSQFVVSLIGISGAIIPLFILKLLKSYRFAAITYVIIGFLSNSFSIIVFSNGKIDARLFPWFLVHTLFAFFTLGRFTGAMMMVISLCLGMLIPFCRTQPFLHLLYQNQENTLAFTLVSNAMTYVFIFFIIDGYLKMYQASNKHIKDLLGINLNAKYQIIDTTNLNNALAEEYYENQQELESNQELVEHLNEKLHYSEGQTKAIQNAVPVGICIFNLTGECIFVNPKGQKILGITSKNPNWLDLIHEKDKTQIVARWAAFIRDQSNFTADFRITVHGKIRWIQSRISPIKEKGKVTSYIGTVTNCTNAHREKELLYLLFETVEHTLDVFCVLKKSGEIVFMNEAAKSFMSQEESSNAFIYETKWITEARWKQQMESFNSFVINLYERQIVDATGKLKSLEVTERKYVFKEEEYIILTAKDRTEKKEQENLIFRSRVSLKKAQAMAKIGSFERNFIKKEYYWSDYLYELFQLPKDTNISKVDFRKFISSDDYEYINAIFKQNIRKESNFSLMYHIKRVDGSEIPVLTTIEVLRSNEGRVIELNGTIQDLSEQYKVEKLNRELLELKTNQVKSKLELEERNLDLILKNTQIKEERIRISSVLTGQENERKRLSRELHDGLGQMLTAIKLKVDMINLEEISEEKVKVHIQDIKADIKKTIFETRKISQDLMPSALEDFGIISALRILSEEFSQIKDIKVLLRTRNFNAELNSDVKITLFRIVQEAFANIAKHSNATKCVVELSNDEKVLKLHIQDNGSNFNKESMFTGSGLNNMKERTELLNGLFTIVQTESNACEITIAIPM